MKKIISILMFVMILFLVACDPSATNDPVKATVINEDLNGYMLVVEVKVEGNVKSLEVLNETVTQVVNGIYTKYYEDFGTDMYTIVIEVYKDTEETPFFGSIGYKVNASLEEPGLSLIKSYLKIQ